MEEFVGLIILLVIIAYVVYVFVVAFFITLDNRRPASTYAWLLAIFLLPGIGILFYIFFGRNLRYNSGKKKRVLLETLSEKLKPIIEQGAAELPHIQEKVADQDSCSQQAELVRLLQKNSYSFLTESDKVEILQNGASKFPRLIQDIKEAKHHIHLAYYLWESDKLTDEVEAALKAKAKEGVEVRVLVDSFGAAKMTHQHRVSLRKHGVQVYRYYDYHTFFTLHTINYRNHRKIAIIDGDIGYVGGMNMGQEYIDGGDRFKSWRDTHLRITGNSVKNLQVIFTSEWQISTREEIYDMKYFPEMKPDPGGIPTQITTSGPDSEWESIRQMYFKIIGTAQKSVQIQTPYFIPDEGLLDALRVAAMSGVNVEVIMTGIPDKKLPFWSATTYFPRLIEAGVKIYRYQEGFLHAKTISIDSRLCAIGTANFDIRSFSIDYEAMAVLYDAGLAQELESAFEKDKEACVEVTQEIYDEIGPLARVRNSLARLISPLL